MRLSWRFCLPTQCAYAGGCLPRQCACPAASHVTHVTVTCAGYDAHRVRLKVCLLRLLHCFHWHSWIPVQAMGPAAFLKFRRRQPSVGDGFSKAPLGTMAFFFKVDSLPVEVHSLPARDQDKVSLNFVYHRSHCIGQSQNARLILAPEQSKRVIPLYCGIR
jgi:hypothetical protein